jgi:hypothetical protein
MAMPQREPEVSMQRRSEEERWFCTGG